jgi:L-alanine-DL-glutamate epimerase-like enolase superfamily enzyme
VHVDAGEAHVPDRPGLGVDVDEGWVRAHRASGV